MQQLSPATTCKWQSFAFILLELEDDFWSAFMGCEGWRALHSTLDEAEFADTRSFFVPPVADILCPGADAPNHYGRWLYRPSSPVRLASQQARAASVSISEVQLLRLPGLSAFIIGFKADEPIEQASLLTINREVFRWLPRTLSDRLPLWQTEHGAEYSLAQWLISVLPASQQKALTQKFAQFDGFGHQLPSFSIVDVSQAAENLRADQLTIGLLTGTPLNQPGYRLAAEVKQQILSDKIEQYWEDWYFANHEGRYLAVLSKDSADFTRDNLTHCYMPMVLLIIYQKLMAAQLLGEFHLCGLQHKPCQLSSVRRRFTRFRHKFVFQRVTHYPQGNRIYNFIHHQADVDGILARITEQIESVDNYEQLQTEQREAKTIVLLTWLAALVLPTSTVAVIFSVEDILLKSFYPFWLISLLTTLVMLVTVFVFLRRINKRKGN